MKNMEIRVNIPANDYVQPSEVREDVVQMISSHIIQQMNRNANGEGLYKLFMERSRDNTYELYIEIYNGSVRQFWTDRRSMLNQVRVRGCEMSTVFDVFRNAGYFIFVANESNGEVVYTFSKKSEYGDRNAARATVFGLFID